MMENPKISVFGQARMRRRSSSNVHNHERKVPKIGPETATKSEPGDRATVAVCTRKHKPPPDDGRYEYRTWPRMSHRATTLLNKNWRQVAAERRTDIYLLNSDSHRVLAKLRKGVRLEIKVLQNRIGTVEYWTMPLSSAFPLTAEVRGMVGEVFKVPQSLPEASGLTAAHLLAALNVSISPVCVRKSRLLFRSASCQAEICRVAIDDWTGHTIAVEAPDIPAIAGGIDALNLGSLPNRSYGEKLLQRRDPLPRYRQLTSGGASPRIGE